MIVRDSRSGKASVHGSTMNTFTGDVWIDHVLASEGISVANVNFTPCARTHWHHHGGGQLLRVIAGSGWVCDKGGEPQRINVGYMVHQAVSHGKVEWYDAVSDEDYSKKR